MIEIIGKYNKAKVLVSKIEDIETSCLEQIQKLLDQPFVEKSNIAIMPDTHAGAGCVIGFTQTIIDKVVPNLVGVDIGCGMFVVKISKNFNFDLKNLDKVWKNKIPMGMEHRTEHHEFCKYIDLSELNTPVNKEKELYALGTLGGGNHFGELDIDENGDYYLVIHSGSRHLGKEVCQYWQNKAIEKNLYGDKSLKEQQTELIEKLKSEHRENEIQTEVEAFKKRMSKIIPAVPKELSYLEGEDLQDYLNDMRICQDFAYWNRRAMAEEIINTLNIKKKYILDMFETIHNYIDLNDMIVRKGAISLRNGTKAIIPINMSFGSLIVEGKGNEDYNFSGPHGAGRIMSRAEAREKLKMEDFKSSMKDVYTTSVCVDTIDEAPMAYKSPQSIIDNIGDVCEIKKIIKPIWNIKAKE